MLRADYPFPEDGHSYMFPIGGGGSAAIEAALDAVEEYTAALGIPLRYCAVPEAGAAVLRARAPGARVCTAHRDWADYLYMLDDLKTFPASASTASATTSTASIRITPAAATSPSRG